MAKDAIEETMVSVAEHATEADARHVAALLVENGVGATIEPVTLSGGDDAPPTSAYRVMVLSGQQVRAEETLGLRDPGERAPSDDDEPMKIDKKKAPWKLFAVIWLVAVITVPIAAFFLSYYLSGS